MGHELHFAENMHLVWGAVELFENTFYVSHTQILKNEDYNTQLLNLNIVYITCNAFKCMGGRLYITISREKKHLLFVFECWQ